MPPSCGRPTPARRSMWWSLALEEAALEEGAFDLGICAAAFHWLDEDATLQKVARLLRPDPFHDATSDLLSGFDIPPDGERGIPFGLDAEVRSTALKRCGAFDVVEQRIVPWQMVLTVDQTVAL
ncbi:methyltransferase domain-containing protein [Pleomorphomonas sp. PLEO]|uniref:methyltransferase domain-containing protein n=1 Tax=Pleomorphomonas sp. PLEO TaxID=3239306 RepID=UPI00351EE8DA